MKYNVGDRVAFMSERVSCLGTELAHKVGYIKQIRKSWLFGVRYVINVAKSEVVYIVPERDIFHKVDRKERTDIPTEQVINNQRTNQ